MTRSQRPSNFSTETLKALSDTQVGFGILCLILGVTDIIITSLRAEKCSEYYLLSSKLQDKSPWSDPASLMFRSPAPSYSQHAYACYLLYYKIWLSTPSLLCGIVFSMAGVVGAGAARSISSSSQDCMKRTFVILSLFNAIIFAPILFALGVWKAFDLFLSTEEDRQWWMQRAVIAIALGTVGLAEWVISIVSTSASFCYISRHTLHSREGSGPSISGQMSHSIASPIYHRDHRDKAKLLDNADYYTDC